MAPPTDTKPEITPIEKDHFSKSNSIKGKRILIVDDETTFLNAFSQLIETLGYQTASAQNGIEAINIYKTWQPDIVLLDIGMPEMDGITFAKRIIKYDPHASIVIMSGYDENGEFGVKEADKKLFKGFLTKPVAIDDLSQFLSRLYN